MDRVPPLSGNHAVAGQPARLGAAQHVAAAVAAGERERADRARVDALAVQVDEAKADAVLELDRGDPAAVVPAVETGTHAAA